MPLTAAVVRGAAPQARPYKLADEKGLFLYVAPSGLRSFRMKFRIGGAEQLLTFGSFPEISLADARDRRDDARQLIRQGINPCEARRRARQEAELEAARGTSFEEVGRAWHGLQAPAWSPEHGRDVLASLERDVFPAIGAKPIGAIETPEIRELLRTIERRGAGETARRTWQRISCIFAHAISEGMAKADPSAPIGKALRRGSGTKRRQPAETRLERARAVLEGISGAGGRRPVALASRLLALTVVRPGVVRGAAWSEFEGIDWATGAAADPIWRVPAARMKLVRARKGDVAFEHIVALSRQAVELLLEIRRAHNLMCAGHINLCALLFPNQRDPRRPIGKNAIAALYADAGFAGRHVPHGWRAAFSTIMNERHRADRAVIDLALAHTPKDKVEAAYNRAEHLERRRELLQEWADLLDGDAA